MNKTINWIILQRAIVFFGLLFLFLLGITIFGSALNGLGVDLVQEYLKKVNSPLLGLFLGMLVTAVVQSSSLITSILVGLVSAGMSLEIAVPIVLGANVGTTITSTLVAFGHIANKKEFRRAVSAASAHAFFNILCVIIFFPLELLFGFLSNSARFIADFIPLNQIDKSIGILEISISPISNYVIKSLNNAYFSLVLGLVFLFLAVRLMLVFFRGTVLNKVTSASSLSFVLSDIKMILSGIGLTILVRSSSVTTSLLVPFVASKKIKLEKAFSFIMGANLGTTFTALLVGVCSNSSSAMVIALVHFLFNFFGVVLFFPNTMLRLIPIFLAKKIGEWSYHNRMIGVVYVGLTFFVIPLLLFLVFK